MRNTYVTDTNSNGFLLRRDNEGIYLDNHFAFFKKLFLNAGLREEIYQTPSSRPSTMFPPRPAFPARTDSRLNPKISGAYHAAAERRGCTRRMGRAFACRAARIWLSPTTPRSSRSGPKATTSASSSDF